MKPDSIICYQAVLARSNISNTDIYLSKVEQEKC